MPNTPLSPNPVLFEELLGVLPGTFAAPLASLATGELAWVIVSGRMASGKDSLAPHLVLPGISTEEVTYGRALREDLGTIIPVVRDAMLDGTFDDPQERERLVFITRERLDYTVSSARALVSAIGAELARDINATGYNTRTDGMRTLLQNMGSAWLPTPDHLPRTAGKLAMRFLAEGRSVRMVGGRLPNEVSVPQLAGALALRLDVSRGTQLRRLAGRDGLGLTPELAASLDHATESSMDDFAFNFRLNNDHDGEEAMVRAIATMQSFVDGELGSRREVAA